MAAVGTVSHNVAVSAGMQSSIAAIAESMKTGCVLFLGAGIHSGPSDGSPYQDRYPIDKRPALGGQLSKHLADKSNFSKTYPNGNPYDLQRVALHFETHYSRLELADEIRKCVHDDKIPSPLLMALSELNFSHIITTNYDQLLEKALHRIGKDPVLSIYKSNHEEASERTDDYIPNREPTDRAPFIFKIHGDVTKTDSIVATEEDYIHFVLRMGDKSPYHPVPDTMKYRLIRWPTLFLGYSLLDYNLRLLFQTLRWKVDQGLIPKSYSVDRAPDPLIFEVYHNRKSYVTYVVEDVWAFVPELYKQVMGKEMPW